MFRIIEKGQHVTQSICLKGCIKLQDSRNIISKSEIYIVSREIRNKV